jgi:hypothetical protein
MGNFAIESRPTDGQHRSLGFPRGHQAFGWHNASRALPGKGARRVQTPGAPVGPLATQTRASGHSSALQHAWGIGGAEPARQRLGNMPVRWCAGCALSLPTFPVAATATTAGLKKAAIGGDRYQRVPGLTSLTDAQCIRLRFQRDGKTGTATPRNAVLRVTTGAFFWQLAPVAFILEAGEDLSDPRFQGGTP